MKTLKARPGQNIITAICHANFSYEDSLTCGKEYQVIHEDGIFASDPYFRFIGDDGKEHHAHQARFKVKQEAAK